jgi:hypothetical protein
VPEATTWTSHLPWSLHLCLLVTLLHSLARPACAGKSLEVPSPQTQCNTHSLTL